MVGFPLAVGDVLELSSYSHKPDVFPFEDPAQLFVLGQVVDLLVELELHGRFLDVVLHDQVPGMFVDEGLELKTLGSGQKE